jgi:hypothetical protein
MGWMPQHDEPIKINSAFNVNATILQFVVASAAEAELGALFHNCQDGIIIRQTLADMGHPQPETPVHCDNTTAVEIAKNTVKRQQSRSMEMRFLGLVTRWHKKCTHLAGTRDKKIWLITGVSTTLGHTTLQFAPGTYIQPPPRGYYRRLLDQAL